MKIVIVDDNLSMRKVLTALFESQGYQVVAALEDGSQLTECVAQLSPDLVCLDYNLPGRDGLELLTDLQASSPAVDVVMLTASNDQALVGKAANLGASGFLHKPFSQPQILDELKQIQNSRRLRANDCENDKDIAPPEPGIAKRTAIIVDDSNSIRILLKSILKELGITVLQTASDGEEGVKAAKKYLPEIICLDVEMPRMSGLEALPHILEASPQSKVVMVTGNPNKTFVEAAISAGAKAYMLKPVRPAYVEAVMKKLLS